ncbi:MAG: adenylate/guanylate cyclase domain-containing protein [Pseudomonadota bacterium]|nr:adenylate/guanylate cyclase domain-containing protein [Pseudomonadota bacterium]
MNGETAHLAVLFADVAGSTRLYETLGDVEAQRRILQCLATLSAIARDNDGEVVKTIGDEIMCRFPSAETAVRAACEIQEALGAGQDSDSPPLQVRIGLQYGPVIVRDNDVFGDTVNVAARMTDIAKARQIFTTEQTIRNLPAGSHLMTREFGRIAVKGRQEELLICQIIWEKDVGSLTTAMPAVRFSEAAAVSFFLSYQDLKVQITQDTPDIVVGRNKQCDIVVHSLPASRVHARFEHRRGKIVLVDISTNGTYVRPQDGTDIYLHREELVLSGEGTISLGMPIADNLEHRIHYKYE